MRSRSAAPAHQPPRVPTPRYASDGPAAPSSTPPSIRICPPVTTRSGGMRPRRRRPSPSPEAASPASTGQTDHLRPESAVLVWCAVPGGPSLLGGPGLLGWCAVRGGPSLLGWHPVPGRPSLLDWHALPGRPSFLGWHAVAGRDLVQGG